MISYVDLNEFAVRVLVTSAAPSEAEIRRAISALYYGLFHRLTAAGASVFAAGGHVLQSQAARAFSHNAMRSLCEKYARARTQPFRAPFDRLVPTAPAPRLVQVANAFIELQTARHEANYDISAMVALQDGVDKLGVATSAHAAFSLIEQAPETAIFLAALLLGDRWTRSG